jgi:hypothetical protein
VLANNGELVIGGYLMETSDVIPAMRTRVEAEARNLWFEIPTDS